MPRDLFAAVPAAQFVISNAFALECASQLLGGIKAQKRFQRLASDLLASPNLTRRLTRELDALDDLLSLRHVHNSDRIEAAHFSNIQPDDPAVEEVCMLLDGLREARSLEHPSHGMTNSNR
ncbi:hypothetical protein [Primorskyibacter sp. 2E233]|uniref:hypothetical protein n=1 Tax=Primorskyibacter sp. 2E233 TaxID=3413431 RepID=UPI003BEF6980